MRILKSLIVFLLLGVFSSTINGQDNFFSPSFLTCAKAKPYSDCAAIFYKNSMLVSDYSPDGVCKLENGMKGKLVVSTVDLSHDGAWPMRVIGFKVAIRNSETNTIWSYSDETLFEVELEDVLKKCEFGDKIIIMTVDKQFSLPHNEIEIVWGC